VTLGDELKVAKEKQLVAEMVEEKERRW